jgi:hypothetical protein
MDNRIGTFNDDGSVKEWPEKTIAGQDYTRPVNMVMLSPRQFIVYVGSTRDFASEIEALRGATMQTKAKAYEPTRPSE